MPLARAAGAPFAVAAALVLAGFTPFEVGAQTQGLPLVPPNAAQAPKAMSTIPPIKIRISVAYATEEEGTVDPAAHDIFEHLPARFHSIQLIDERTVDVMFGESATIALKTGTEVRLLPIAVHGGQLHLQLEMPEVINTSMRMANSRAFYVGGVPHQGGTLVFKLVPDFSAYIESPPSQRAATPEATKATGKR